MALYEQNANTGTQESFVERQRRLMATQTAQQSGVNTSSGTQTATPTNGGITSPAPSTRTTTTTSTQSGTAATPVSGTGKIPEPAPIAAPVMQAAPAPAPSTADYTPAQAAAAGLNWVPKDHPSYGTPGFIGYQAQASGAGTTAASQATAPRPAVNTGAQSSGPLNSMDLGNETFKTYQASQLGANQGDVNDLQTAWLKDLLLNPETLNAATVSQMKERDKEAALLMQKQGLGQAAQNAASRGLTNGAAFGAQQNAIRSDVANAILGRNRDLDIAAAQQNRADVLQALGLSENILGGQINRAQAQADENYRQFTTERAAQDAEIQRILSQFGMNEAALASRRADRSLDLQGELGRGGLALDRSRLNESSRQFDAGHGLNILQFLEGKRQHNNNLGFNYTQLNQQGQQNLMNTILNSLR